MFEGVENGDDGEEDGEDDVEQGGGGVGELLAAEMVKFGLNDMPTEKARMRFGGVR